MNFLESTAALKFLQNRDRVNLCSGSNSLWVFADEVEPEPDPPPLQCNGFGKMCEGVI